MSEVLGVSMRFLPVMIALIVATLAGCIPSVSTQLDGAIVVSSARPTPWPQAQTAPTDAAPKIEKIWMSSLHLREGDSIYGAIATTTNVASVEVRTATFSINVPRRSFGQFTFRLNVLVFPPLLKHTYPLLIIARNTAGVEDVKNAYLVVE
jgi:hypothetical protein